MAINPLDSVLYSKLFGDAELGELFSDKAEIAALIHFERALARAEGNCGVIPVDAAARIDESLARATVEPAELAAGTASAGVPVPALIGVLRTKLDPEAGQWLHWGATSQDASDTGQVLRLREALNIIEIRLQRLGDALAEAAERYSDHPMAGRTRSQIATPITFGLRIAQWLHGIVDLAGSLDELRGRLLRVQFGGASGANTAVAPHGQQVATVLAQELDLSPTPPWHCSRGAVAECAAWLARLAGSLGKMAGDLVLMGRPEIAEAKAGEGGASSTMPQKSNPVAAETIVALARYATALTTPAHLALLHAEERDGTAWSLEWIALPQIVVATGASLRHALHLIDTLAASPARMRTNLDLGGGGAMAEAASFALAAQIPRAEAQALVKRAVAEASDHGRSLADTLVRHHPEIDWQRVLDPATAAAPAAEVVHAITAMWRDRSLSGRGNAPRTQH